MSDCIIRGLGRYAPERILDNDYFESIVDTSDEWIMTRTGIRERRMAAPGETCSDMAHQAALAALDKAGMEASELTHILVPTFTPDAPIPSSACLLGHKLGVDNPMAMDVSAACSGFLYGLETARSILSLHPEAKVLVAASEVVTGRVNFNDRATCVLFGDGSGAAVLTAGGPGARVRDVILGSDGALGDLLTVLGGGSTMPPVLGETIGEDWFVKLRGQEVFKHAVRNMVSMCERVLARNGKSVDDVDVFVSHQANLRIIDAVGKKLGMPAEKVFVNIHKYGNTSAASLAIALTEAVDEGFIKPGDTVLSTTFGGGFTWGAGLFEF